jgi:hypothetical protein
MAKVYKITSSSPDLRDKIANQANERWYNTIVLHVSMKDLFTKAAFIPNDSSEMNISNLSDILNEHSLLIDCYSFSSHLSRADVCIGFNKDWSQPTDFVIELVSRFMEKQSYITCIKSPSLTAKPKTNLKKDAITIGVSMRIISGNKEGTSKLHKDLVSLYSILVRYWERV